MTQPTCEYCRNKATRYAAPPDSHEPEDLCEVHYAEFGNSFAKVDPDELDECMRCGTKATNKRGTKQRLIDHHVNYYLDLTVPLCDPCHAEVHNDPESPYYPRGNRMTTGTYIHKKEYQQ